MLSFLSLKFILSWKGLYTIAIAAFLFWVLRDYPQWRSQHERSEKAAESLKKLSNSMNSDSERTQIKKAPQTDSAGITSTRVQSKGTEKLSIIHYVLVSPFAALYIIVRAVIDSIKYSLYYILWWCEKTLPYIDDCLFAFVTITIPKLYNQTVQWWIQSGKPAYLRRKAYIKQEILPSIIDGLEKFFVSLYKALCVAQKGIVEFVTALNKFIKRHDWQLLMEELGNIIYDRFWTPFSLVLTRAINLYKLLYAGVRATVISIVNEAKWICTVVIPALYQYIISTRLAKALYSGTVWTKEKLQWLFTQLNTYILAPTVGRLLTWIVEAIDTLILLLQQHTFHKKLAKLYKIYGPKLVWVTVELSGFLFDLVAGVRHIWHELLYPAYRLFIKHVRPRLAVAYRTLSTCISHWFWSKLYPAWTKMYPYLNVPLFWFYMNVTLPFCREFYTIISTTATYITQHMMGQIWFLAKIVMSTTALYAQQAYNLIQAWLIKQAPLLSRILQKSYEAVVNSCNWASLQQEVMNTATQLYNWMAEQSSSIYLSLERSLNTWVEEQQEEIAVNKPLK